MWGKNSRVTGIPKKQEEADIMFTYKLVGFPK